MNLIDHSISLLRVIAMLMIVFCHLANWFNYSIIAQFFNVGVEIFLLISGYLYSTKKIDIRKFWINRIVKLLMPVYILLIVLFIYYMSNNCLKNVYMATFFHFLNLQGLPVLYFNAKIPGYDELAHTWFLTALFLCYFLMIITKKCEKKIKIYMTWYKIFILIFISTILHICLLFLNIQIGYFITFFLGYIWGKECYKKDKSNINKKGELIVSSLMITIVTVRLISRAYIDDTLIYNHFISIIGHIIISFWFLYTIQYLNKYIGKKISQIVELKLIRFLEKNSYYIYLTHYFFFYGVLSLNKISIPVYQKMIVFFFGTLILSVLLEVISSTIELNIKRFSKHNGNK